MKLREYLIEKSFPKEFKPFIDVVKKSKSVEDAYEILIKINTVPFEVSQKFFKMYPEPTPMKALEKFYKDIKG